MAAGSDEASLNEGAPGRPAVFAMESLWKNFVARDSLDPAARPLLLKAEAALHALAAGKALPEALGAPAFGGSPAAQRVQVFAAAQGTAYSLEQRDALVAALRAAGAAAEACDESDFHLDFGPPAVLVAPHEFITVSPNLRQLLDKRTRPGRRLLMVNTAPVASEGFRAMVALSRGEAFAQWDLASAVMLRAMDVPAHFLPPAFAVDTEPPLPRFAKGGAHMERRVHDYTPPGGDDWEARPLDVASFNIYTPWVKASLARAAAALSLRSCMLIRIQADGLVVPPEGAYISARLARRAKIMLRLGASPLYFDSGPASVWSGWLAGALVLSEPGFRIPGLLPTQHYVECPLERLPEALAYYLDSEAGRAEALRVRARAREALARHYPSGRLALGLLGLLAGEA